MAAAGKQTEGENEPLVYESDAGESCTDQSYSDDD